jgi:hypothetical protein
MLRRLPVVALVAAGLAGCGGDEEARLSLTTPPERKGEPPLPEVRREQEQAARAARIRPTQADAERSRPVLRAWANTLRRTDDGRAAAFFTLPAIVAQGAAIKLETLEEVRDFNLRLPCGARLVAVDANGRYVVGTFVLTPRPQHVCTAEGRRVRVAFVLRGGKIAEWREVPDTPGAAPGPDAPEGAPAPPPERKA